MLIKYNPATTLLRYYYQPASSIISQLLGFNSRCFCSSSTDCVTSAMKRRRDDKMMSGDGKSVDILGSVVQWVTSLPRNQDDQHPPTTSTRFTFSKAQDHTLSIRTQDHTTAQLTPQQSLSASIKLLSALSSSTFPILESDALDCSNLIRKPPQTHPLTVEFSSPNIAKPLHMGHLRSTITGSFVRNVAEFAGHEVESVCFLGDWGRQFGVLRGGVEQEIKGADFSSFVETLSLHDLLQIYVRASNRIDGGDAGLRKAALAYSSELEESFGAECGGTYRLWEHTRRLTVDHLKSCYESLNIRFDVYEGESEFRVGSEYTDRALELMGSMGLSELCEDGTVRVVGKEGNNVLLKKDGSSVYLLRDVACALRRSERSGLKEGRSSDGNRHFVYVVDSGQSEHFKNLFELLSGLGVSTQQNDPHPFSSTHSYVPFNRVGGMSTRSGNFVLLSQVIAEGTALLHEERARSKNARNLDDVGVSQRLAVSGLIVSSLKMRRGKAYDFDWEEALRGSGNSGVSLQYTVSRLRSLFRRVREEVGVDGGMFEDEEMMGVVFREGSPGSLVELVVCLMNFEDTFWKSYTQLEPCILVAYAFNLSDKLSSVLSSIRIVDGPDRELAGAALWVLGIGERVLCGCLRVVGVGIIGGEGF